MPTDEPVKPTSAARRRAACDQRKREAGLVKTTLWLDKQGAADLDWLLACCKPEVHDQGAMASVAVRYLAKACREGMTVIWL